MPTTKAAAHAVSEGYITKAEASQKFNRHSVTLSDDIIRALNNKDQEVLRLLKLVTKDNKERRATTLTVAKVKALKKQGMQPRWFLHPDDVVPLFIKRRSKDPSSKRAAPINTHSKEKNEEATPSGSPPSDHAPGKDAIEVAVLRSKNELLLEINADLKADKSQLREDNKQLRGVLKRQAKALQETGGGLLIEKQINRDLRLQIEAAESTSQSTSNDQGATRPQPAVLVGSDGATQGRRPRGYEVMRTNQTPSTCFLNSTSSLLPSSIWSTPVVCGACHKEITAFCFSKGVVWIGHGQSEIITILATKGEFSSTQIDTTCWSYGRVIAVSTSDGDRRRAKLSLALAPRFYCLLISNQLRFHSLPIARNRSLCFPSPSAKPALVLV